MSLVERLAAEHRAALQRGEKPALRRLIGAYARSYGLLKAEADVFARRLEAAIEAGEAISPSWAFRRGNLDAIRYRYGLELARLAEEAGLVVSELQEWGLHVGVDRAEASTLAEIQTRLRGPLRAQATTAFEVAWTRPDIASMREIVGFLADGTPLDRILAGYGKQAAANMQRSFIRSTVLGKGPRFLARDLKQDLGGNMVWALRIARTEMLRASRHAQQISFEENDSIVGGWIWSAKLGDGRTCIGCIAMHGTEHKPTETMHSHPNCRCSPVPITKTYAELAEELKIPGLAEVPESRVRLAPGREWFDAQPIRVQSGIVHPKALRAYLDGAVGFDDLVTIRKNRVWGDSPGATPLKEVLRGELAGRYL